MNKTSKDEQALQEEIAAMKEQIVSEATLAQGLCGDDREAIANVSSLIAKGCSICKEKFIKVWNEAEEEWSYKNAVVVDKMVRIDLDYRSRTVRVGSCRSLNIENFRCFESDVLWLILFFSPSFVRGLCGSRFQIYHATCHADLVRSTARQAAAAAAANAAAVATAAAESTSAASPSLSSTLPTGSKLSDTTSTTAQMDIKDEDMKEDIKPELKMESDQHAQSQEDTKDHDMTLAATASTTDSDLPTSLKRKVRTRHDFSSSFDGSSTI